jgi:MFS family permease
VADSAANAAARALTGRVLFALVAGQVGLHAAMAGLRLAVPLQTLHEGMGAGAAGLLLASFAFAPALLALHAGRMADRYGYHRPVRIAALLVAAGALMAMAATRLGGWPHLLLLSGAGVASGAGANMGMLAIQRTATLAARDPTERVRVFSWLGVAPSLSNVVGPVLAGLWIDLGGFAAAYALMLALPLAALLLARRVPRHAVPAPARADREPGSVFTLLRLAGMKRLLFVNWLLSACWDVHAFAVPVIGHERGFSASTIGLVLGSFTASVTAVRLVIPALAHRMRERMVVRAAMLGTGVIFALYPFAASAWAMAALSVLLGLTLGAVQPMIMATLHHLTPEGRHGEALAFRSMAINLSSAVLPLAFGAAGAAVGAGLLFWVVGAAVAAGSWPARGLPEGVRT